MINNSKILDIGRNLPRPLRFGRVKRCVGLIVEVEYPGAFIGEACEIVENSSLKTAIPAEVVGFRDSSVLLMPFFGVNGVVVGNVVRASGGQTKAKVGASLLGRVVNAFSEPIDLKQSITGLKAVETSSVDFNPMKRDKISEVYQTGIRCIDGFCTLGKGQRVGLLAGSGVGKSTLISAICKHSVDHINVVALIGERGREVEEFVRSTLGETGLKNSVVIAATAQDSPIIRVRAAYTAVAIAEYFSKQGHEVLFCMDSITRFATALREIGLATGEPPTVKGYTPTVFSKIPDIIERFGNFKDQGSMTAILTVLVDSDDFNDPVVDASRAILDGHIVLSRSLAESHHFPAIDISKSVSRLSSTLMSQSHSAAAEKLKKVFFDYQQSKEIIELGIFESDQSSSRDELIGSWNKLREFLCQDVSEYQDHIQIIDKLLAL